MDKSNEIAKRKKQEEYAKNPDAVECLICGKKYIQVCTHVVQAHGMTAKQYKDKFGLWRRGIIKGGYKKKKSRITLENESYSHLPEAGKKTRFKKGSKARFKRGYKLKYTQELLK